jgi:CRP-like cAMP-binding protein/Fe-S-cluster-containing dehydrogenase component
MSSAPGPGSSQNAVALPLGAEPVSMEELRRIPILAESVKKKGDKWFENKILPYVFRRRFSPAEKIVREGEYRDSAYYLDSGSVEVLVERLQLRPDSGPGSGPGRQQSIEGLTERFREALSRKGAEPLGGMISAPGHRPTGTIILSSMPIDLDLGKRNYLDPGEIFGEIAALGRYPHSATVVARGEVEVLEFRTNALRALKKESPAFSQFIDERYRRRSLVDLLRNVSLFEGCTAEFMAQLQRHAELLSFEPAEPDNPKWDPNQSVIVREGDPADALYLVRGGYVRVSRKWGSGEITVAYLSKGQYAGEVALLLDEPWPFTLTAFDNVDVVKLPAADFRRLIAEQPQLERQLWAVAVERLKERGGAARSPATSEFLATALDQGWIEGESVLLIDLATCTHCDDCVRGCAATHEGQPRFVREGFKYKNYLVPGACFHCTDPQCMIGCPTGAISRAFGTLEVTIDPVTCIGCRLCANNCPWDNIFMTEEMRGGVVVMKEGKKGELEPRVIATKCDLCIGTGGQPACVYNCPHGSAVRVNFHSTEGAKLAEFLKLT